MFFYDRVESMKKLKLLQTFLRLDHFTPFYITIIPTILCSFTFGYQGLIIKTIALLSVSTLLLIIGGCIWNDLIDLEYDKQCDRTKHRPMAAGKIPTIAAITCIPFFMAYLFTTNWFFGSTHIYFYIALLLTVIYPFSKRFTKAPQIMLSLINFGPIIAYLQVTDLVKPIMPAISFYIMGAIWILLYDTIYAWQDREDDKRLGIGNIGLLITPKYMPLFIDLCWLCLWICFAIHYSVTSWIFWISAFIMLGKGLSQKSRFIKNQL